MKNAYLILFLLGAGYSSFAQQFSLYNTRTLFDSFENPSQKAFIADTAKKYSFNFFIPTVSVNTAAIGPAQPYIKRLAYEGILNAQGISLGEEERNKILLNSNTYLMMFRVFRSVKNHREMGFGWQIKSDSYIDATNETLAIFKNFKSFTPDLASNLFDNSAISQTYHQFSFVYREDWNRRLGIGLKLSYLSGIAHNQLKIKSSSLSVNQTQNSYTLNLDGKFESNFEYNELEGSMAIPGFKNPGVALTLSGNYQLPYGWFLLGNIKDLGFIKWHKESYNYTFDRSITINNASSPDAAKRLSNELSKFISKDYENKSFTSMINGKAEIMVNKNLGLYQPNFLISKSFLFPGADIALINNISYGKSVFSVSSAYNTINYFQLGGQYMFKSPNFELFMGSDNIFKTYYFTKGFINEDSEIGNGYTGASVYFGLAVKFGPAMQRRANSTIIPGVDNVATGGFFRRLFRRN